MDFSAVLIGETQTISLGANAKLQAAKFAICLGIGLLLGIVALLYFRKSSHAERFVTDLFATLCLGGGYIACLEIVFGGKFELYGLTSYLLGTVVVPAIYAKVKRIIAKRQADLKD